jgi:hypothetical protein
MWKTKSGQVLHVQDMSEDHVRNSLKFVIRDYTLMCIAHGARYTAGIQVDHMSVDEVREMLTQVCTNPQPVKLRVMKACFGPEWDEIRSLFHQ